MNIIKLKNLAVKEFNNCSSSSTKYRSMILISLNYRTPDYIPANLLSFFPIFKSHEIGL